MVRYLFIIITLLFASVSEAQVKPPEILTDYLSVYYLSNGSINALINDYSYEGDSLAIFAITGIQHGSATFSDSIIFYYPPVNVSMYKTDVIHYIIKDFTTGLYSEPGDVIVDIERLDCDYLDRNNIHPLIQSVSNQFKVLNCYVWNEPRVGMEVPAGSGKSTILNSALWVTGLDPNGYLHTACERDRIGASFYASTMSFDFWNGPVVDEGFYNLDYLIKNNVVWKINLEDIVEHQQHYADPGYIIPGSISKWPVSGDSTYTGLAEVLAPFKDINLDGMYNPSEGDYPDIKGHQAIYSICNDDYNDHTESGGRKLGIEIHSLAYVYDCPNDSAFNNTIFIHYDVINRSDTNYQKVYIGNYTNFGNGYPADDMIGCDTLHNSFYAYNSDNFDDTTSIYYPGYGASPPAQGVIILNRKMDHFIFARDHVFPPVNDTIHYSAPWFDHEYYNIMQSIWSDSVALTYGGNGYNTGEATNYAFAGDPVNNLGWTHNNSGIPAGNMHGIGSCGPFELNSKDTLTIELAYVFARDYNGTNLSSVDLMKERIERIQWFYDNDSTPCSTPWSGLGKIKSLPQTITINPNPVNNVLNVSSSGQTKELKYFLFDISGRMIRSGSIEPNGSINCSSLIKGIYLICFRSEGQIYNLKFVKQ
ncbi:MAG: T9SS type A sorting domain-containing protein [Bacteroidales bacterium]|nr:T9SS type A sorting domain-containing protein [Bacteroidales bacterium]